MRRIPFNLLIGTYGILCLVIFFWANETSGRLQPGEDAVEAMALLAAPLALNLCYSLGWIAELVLRSLSLSVPAPVGPFLLKLGIGFSLFIVSLPTMLSGGYRLLQALHVLR